MDILDDIRVFGSVTEVNIGSERYMSELKFEYYASVEEKDVEWLWYPYIPYGKLTLLQGDPGEGKSTFILNIVALLTRGKPMPDGYLSVQ